MRREKERKEEKRRKEKKRKEEKRKEKKVKTRKGNRCPGSLCVGVDLLAPWCPEQRSLSIVRILLLEGLPSLLPYFSPT